MCCAWPSPVASHSPVSAGRYSAILAARVGRLADTYRGTFAIQDTRPGSELVVSVDGRGRCGTLEVDLRVRLDEGHEPGTTALVYDARTRVGGLVSRLGRAPLTLAGGHITGCFFRDLERAMRSRSRAVGRPGQLSTGPRQRAACADHADDSSHPGEVHRVAP